LAYIRIEVPFNTFDVRHRGRFPGTAGDLDQVDACRVQPSGHNLAIFEAEAATLKISGVELHADREVRSDFSADGSDDREKKASASGEVSAPLVFSQV
jgi:hypothetical protein